MCQPRSRWSRSRSRSQRRNQRTPSLLLSAALLLVATGWAPLASAFTVDEEPEATLGSRGAFTTPALHVEPSVDARPSAVLWKDADISSFFAKHSDRWEVRWDRRSDRPNLLQGAGVPVIPGRGNGLTASDVGFKAGDEPTLGEVEATVRAFLREHDVLRVRDVDLVIDDEASAVSGRDRHFWNIELQQVQNGVPVEGANAFVRINHGNIVQLGTEKLAPVRISTEPAITANRALVDSLAMVGIDPASVELEEEELVIYPAMGRHEARGQRYEGVAGQGYEHVLVWRFVASSTPEGAGSKDEGSRFQLLVDAQTGEVLELVDLEMLASVEAQIYPRGSDQLVSVALPFTAVDVDGTDVVTDAAGDYAYTGGTATVSLDGHYFTSDDSCGSIALSDATTGDLDLGGVSGTDCDTPAVGGAGNTNAARTAFYHLTRMNRKAATYLPTHSWLDSTVTVRTNRSQECNASWNGVALKFHLSDDGCGNSGENVDIILHEWGHGMDQNAGGSSSDKGSREAAADIFAVFEARDGCQGDGWKTSSCKNCNSDCTGSRDLEAFAVGGISTIARPDTVESDTGIKCQRWSCPFYLNDSPYQGPMGYQGHCESQIASTAVWDVAQNFVDAYGEEDGWTAVDDLWWSTLDAAGSAYQVTSGGQCNPSASVDGCGSSNWYTVFLAADDDDGDLSNGTPNGCRIWDAFEAHGIACGSRPACDTEPEVGSVTTDETVRTVALGGFDDAIVAIGAPSHNGSDPSVLQISNVGSTSFKQRLREWEYLDGTHADETAGYLVVEAGSSTFAGLQVEAGSRSASPARWKTVTFARPFSSPPVVLATVASRKNGKTTVARVRDVGTSTFEVRVQVEELLDVFASPFSFDETVHWIALEQGTGTFQGQHVLVGSTTQSVTESWSTISFGGSYENPIWLGGSQTFGGSDPAGVRYRNLSATGVEVTMQEETSRDSETTHADEVIGYVVIGD